METTAGGDFSTSQFILVWCGTCLIVFVQRLRILSRCKLHLECCALLCVFAFISPFPSFHFFLPLTFFLPLLSLLLVLIAMGIEMYRRYMVQILCQVYRILKESPSLMELKVGAEECFFLFCSARGKSRCSLCFCHQFDGLVRVNVLFPPPQTLKPYSVRKLVVP